MHISDLEIVGSAVPTDKAGIERHFADVAEVQ
jgi:hypothetical protein